MIFSAQSLLSDNQAVTATALSTNVIDLGTSQAAYGAKAAFHRDIGKGAEIPFVIQVTEDFATLTSLTITIETSDAENMTSSTVLASSGAIAAADLKAGFQVPLQRLPNGVTGRYLAVRYTVAGTNASAGKVTAGVTMGVQTNVTGV
jgi:hypothetical protein